MRALGVSRLAAKLQLAGEGRSASPDVRQALENLLRAFAVGYGVGEGANVRHRDRPAERGRARRVPKHLLHLIERAGGVRRRQVEQAGFGEQLDAAAVLVSADDAPHVAIGERAERVRSGASVAGDVSGYLLLRAVLLRLAVAVQVRAKRLRLDDGGGGNAPRYLRRIPPDDDVRAVPVYLPFAPRLRFRETEMAQNRVDKVAYRIRLAERGRPQYRGVLPNQPDCFQRVWHWEYSYPVGFSLWRILPREIRFVKKTGFIRRRQDNAAGIAVKFRDDEPRRRTVESEYPEIIGFDAPSPGSAVFNERERHR